MAEILHGSLGEKRAEFFQTGMEQEAHVGLLEPGDLGDLAIREVVLKLETDDLALVRRQRVEQTEE